MKSEGNRRYLWKYFRYILLVPFLCFFAVFVYGFFLVFWGSFPLYTMDGDPLNFETEIRRDVSAAKELKFIRARDQEPLSYRFYDSHSSCILIFLHGSSYHGQYLHNLADYLSQNGIAKLCLPNLRGHYFSGLRRGDIDYIGQYEDDLVDFIEGLRSQGNKGDIYLGGHSSGAGLAIRFAGGQYHDLVKDYVLLSPMIPLAPSNRQGSGGGWARVNEKRILGLNILNLFGIKAFNALPVIEFNKPVKFWDGTETLCYSYRLNTSYHPRYEYQQDIAVLGDSYLLLVGENDEVNNPEKFLEVFPGLSEENYALFPTVNHLSIVYHQPALEKIAQWFEEQEKIEVEK